MSDKSISYDVNGITEDLLRSRIDFYKVLSSNFLYAPDEERVRRFLSPDMIKNLDTLFGSAVSRMFIEFTEQIRDPKEDSISLRQEFMDLFKVPTGRYVAPYESVYRSSGKECAKRVSGMLMSEITVDVQRWYRLAAAEIASDAGELPDHIGMEFGFMAYLCEKEKSFAHNRDTQRATRAREMQKDFLATHILTWITMLRDKIREHSILSYYPAIAELAVAFAHLDKDFLYETLSGQTLPNPP